MPLDHELKAPQLKDAIEMQKMFDADKEIEAVYSQNYQSQTMNANETMQSKFADLGRSLSEKYDAQFNLKSQSWDETGAGSRERKRVRKEYQEKKKKSETLPALMHAKVGKMADKFAETSGFDISQVQRPSEMKWLMEYNLDAIVGHYDDRKIELLKKIKKDLPAMFLKLKKYENLATQAVVDEDYDNTAFHHITRTHWKLLEAEFNATLDVIKANMPKFAESEAIYRDHEFLLARDERIERDGVEPVIDAEYSLDLKESLKPRMLDFNADYTPQIMKLEREGKAYKYNSPEAKQIRKEIKDLQQMQYMAGLVKDIAKKNNVTPEEVQETVNAYLKKVANLSTPTAYMGIDDCFKLLFDRYQAGAGSESTNELAETHYCATASKTHAVLTHGKLGDEFTSGDSSPDFGQFAVTLDKSKLKDRISFVVGDGSQISTTRGRSLENPDLLALGSSIENVYARAKELESTHGLIESVNEEVSKWKLEAGSGLECHFHGTVDASMVNEIYYSISLPARDVYGNPDSYRDILLWEQEFEHNFGHIYQMVKVINANPEKFGRKGMAELPIYVHGTDGEWINLSELDYIFKDGWTDHKTRGRFTGME